MIRSRDFHRAGEISEASGGVMEAALRTVYEVVTGKELPNINFEAPWPY